MPFVSIPVCASWSAAHKLFNKLNSQCRSPRRARLPEMISGSTPATRRSQALMGEGCPTLGASPVSGPKLSHPTLPITLQDCCS